jgi:hypothetical protein
MSSAAGDKRPASVEPDEGGGAANTSEAQFNRGDICPHKRRRAQCKECKSPRSFCEHKRQKVTCKECGGSGICQHNKRRSRCRECGGSSICPHQRIRSTCKECGGSAVCPHKRIRAQCKDCGGSAVCSHQLLRSQCKACGGSQFCQHQRIRNSCKECGGSRFCPHQRRKSTCKECATGAKRPASVLEPAEGGGATKKQRRVKIQMRGMPEASKRDPGAGQGREGGVDSQGGNAESLRKPTRQKQRALLPTASVKYHP